MNLPFSITKTEELDHASSLLFICNSINVLKDFGFEQPVVDYFLKNCENGKLVVTHKYPNIVGVVLLENSGSLPLEKIRNCAAQMANKMSDEKLQNIALFDLVNSGEATLAALDGLIAASYRFEKYITKTASLKPVLLNIEVVSPAVTQLQINELSVVWAANWLARNLVNETPAALTAVKLAEIAVNTGNEVGFVSTVFSKKELEEMGFGGLLGVNRGSVEPPSFTVMEYKPSNAVNAQPVVLVGKGVVYDTGGINIKTAPGGLDDMKCDMAGAATVIGTLAAVAANKLPIYLIGLVPATDNRPGFNAYVPGDVLTMHNGMTVEVMNTDAEGRLILADALSFAKKYDPKLVIDLATLTGSAVMAIGSYGTVAMGNVNNQISEQLSSQGEAIGERLAWFPFWDEYDELLKSDVADMKNIGGREAGAITAGKFLARFTNYPWVHLDIAGPAFLSKPMGYRQVGATGVGVRLLYNFLKSQTV